VFYCIFELLFACLFLFNMSDPEYPNFQDFIKMMHLVSTDARRNFIFSWPLNIVLRSKHQEITVIIILINGNNSDVSETR